MPYHFICRTYTTGMDGCCGVATLYGLEAHYEAFRAKEGVEYPDLGSEEHYLSQYGFLKFEKKYPEQAKIIMGVCNAHLKDKFRELRSRPAALYVAWFVKTCLNDDDDCDSFEDTYHADALRIAMMRWPGSLNMGAFVNPNTGNIIHGIQISELDREVDHEDSGEFNSVKKD